MTQIKAGGTVLLFGLMSWLAASASAGQGTPSPQRPAGGRGGFTSAPSEPGPIAVS